MMDDLDAARAHLRGLDDPTFCDTWDGTLTDESRSAMGDEFFRRRRSLSPYKPRYTGTEGTTDQVDDYSAIERLARLDPIAYERVREDEAKKLGIRVAVLDAEVGKARSSAKEGGSGASVMFPPVEPWLTPVDGAELLNEMAATIRRFVVLPDHADVAIALWIAFTYLTAILKVAPILAIESPEKRCGKTTLLTLLNVLVAKPLSASNISPAALFRSIEKWSPTLVIDEADTFLRGSDELRGILNSGHTRASAFVVRTVGDDHEPRRFATWGAKAIALIGGLPDTLADRSIAIELRRKLPSERVQKMRHDGAVALQDLARRLLRWTTDTGSAIGTARPSLPENLHDRAADNWESLLAIADAAGGDWPERARKAAIALSGGSPDGDSLKVELLRDIQSAFASKKTDRLSSEELVNLLTEDKERPWVEYRHGKPLSQKQLGRLLAPFRIGSSSVRLPDCRTPKGFHLEQFQDAFTRYLPTSEVQHRHKPASMRVVADQRSATEGDALRIAEAPQASIHAGCGGVALREPLDEADMSDDGAEVEL